MEDDPYQVASTSNGETEKANVIWNEPKLFEGDGHMSIIYPLFFMDSFLLLYHSCHI